MKKTAIVVISALCGAVLAEDAATSPKPVFGGAAANSGSAYGSRSQTDYYGVAYDSDSGDFHDTWIKGKLSVGLSLSTLSLSDGKRPANTDDDFLGNINELTTKSGTRIFPTLNYRVFDYLMFGISYAEVEARTKNFNNLQSDGNATLKGPVFTVEAAYPLWEELAIPHIGVGFAAFSGDFKEDAWWHAGYSSPEDYESVGRDNNRYRRHRYIDVDDESCAFFVIGVSCRPVKHMLLDFSYRKLSLDPDCEFGYESKGRKSVMRTGDFDMSCDVFLFSVSYLF